MTDEVHMDRWTDRLASQNSDLDDLMHIYTMILQKNQLIKTLGQHEVDFFPTLIAITLKSNQ